MKIQRERGVYICDGRRQNAYRAKMRALHSPISKSSGNLPRRQNRRPPALVGSLDLVFGKVTDKFYSKILGILWYNSNMYNWSTDEKV